MSAEPFEIVLEGPGKNAMSSSLMSFIRERLREAERRPVLLTGAGDALSAGLDLKEVAGADAPAMAEFLDLLEATVSDLYHHPAPTVACVNGHAIAGGCVLTLACDHRVSTSNPKARIGLNEVAIGVRFPPGVLGVVRRRLPVRHLERVLLGGGLHDPRMALELGLVDEISDDPLSLARERLRALAAHPSAAYAALKERLHEGASDVTDEERRRFDEHELLAWTSPELKARLSALLRR